MRQCKCTANNIWGHPTFRDTERIEPSYVTCDTRPVMQKFGNLLLSLLTNQQKVFFWPVFTALHCMQRDLSYMSVCPSVCQTRELWQIVTKRKHLAKKVQLESVQLRKHRISKATPTSRQSIWHIISIFSVFLLENNAFWEVPPGKYKYRIAYLMLTECVACDLHSSGVSPCAQQCRSRAPHPLSTLNK